MSHLTSLGLDEAAAGLPLEPEAQAHLAGCAECRTKLAKLTQANQALLLAPDAKRLLTLLTAAAPPQRRSLGWGLAALLPFAAGLALWLAWPRHVDDGLTLKGTVTLELLDARDVSVTRAQLNDELTLAVGAAGHRFGAVFAIDENGGITLIYPVDGEVMGPLLGTARQKLDQLIVTPGNTLVIGFFDDAAAPLSPLREALHAALVTAASPFDVTVPGTARVLLKVE